MGVKQKVVTPKLPARRPETYSKNVPQPNISFAEMGRSQGSRQLLRPRSRNNANANDASSG